MPKLDTEVVGTLIRTDRRYRGNLRKLASATGIPYDTLRNAVGAAGDPMRFERVSLLADALDVDIKQIVEAIPIPPKNPKPKGPKGPRKGRGKPKGPKTEDELAAAS